MRIAVDSRIFQKDEVQNSFIKEIFFRLANHYSEHLFIFLFDKPIDSLPALPENVTPVIITPAPSNLLSYKWWYDFKVPRALKKCKADVFVGASGLCSVTPSIPQVLMVSDLSFLHYPAFFPKENLSFYKKFTPVFLKKAIAVATFTDFVKKEITGTYPVPEEKITVIDIAADNSLKPVLWEEREKVKEEYAKGCEYFVFNSGLNPRRNLVNLLKAFSIFKKWQKSNMKLLVTIHREEYKDQLEKLNTYKYKNEVILANNLSKDQLAIVKASAYAMIFPSSYEGFDVAVLEAMKSEVPVITSAGSSMAETAGEAAFFADIKDPNEIADQMKRVFKDEQLRNKMIVAGKERAKMFSWDKTITLTWQLIQQAVSK
ncbi:glycosyltransferase family 4 protein [Segetibacter koreensis]|uniref:glycosyltransferase family 4 protein n=1 Tax=Segetibacter koreensis TaxID=398037 RepID=UPI0003661784|nr:glycosyltransferase family 1 protein [Segetibacter koreensis]